MQEANVPSHVSPNNAKMPSSKTAFQCAPPQYSKSQLVLSTPRVKLESKEDQNLHIDNHRECLKYLQALTTSPFPKLVKLLKMSDTLRYQKGAEYFHTQEPGECSWTHTTKKGSFWPRNDLILSLT